MIYPLYSRYTCNIYILCAIVGLGGHGFRPPALLTRSKLRLARVTGRSCSSAEEQHMSTLTTEDSSPVKVAQVFADFRHGMPNAGTVYFRAERHKVQVYRTVGGIMGKCGCPDGGA